MFCMILRGPRDLAKTQRAILFPENSISVFFRPTSANGSAFHFLQLLDGTVKIPSKILGNPQANPRNPADLGSGFPNSYYTHLSVEGMSHDFVILTTHTYLKGGMSQDFPILTTHTYPLRACLPIF